MCQHVLALKYDRYVSKLRSSQGILKTNWVAQEHAYPRNNKNFNETNSVHLQWSPEEAELNVYETIQLSKFQVTKNAHPKVVQGAHDYISHHKVE